MRLVDVSTSTGIWLGFRQSNNVLLDIIRSPSYAQMKFTYWMMSIIEIYFLNLHLSTYFTIRNHCLLPFGTSQIPFSSSSKYFEFHRELFIWISLWWWKQIFFLNEMLLVLRTPISPPQKAVFIVRPSFSWNCYSRVENKQNLR